MVQGSREGERALGESSQVYTHLHQTVTPSPWLARFGGDCRTAAQKQKAPLVRGFWLKTVDQLLDLGFLVRHMLTGDGIELRDLHLFRHGALVLGGRVEMTGTCGRFQLDLVASAFAG